jgi:tRNA 5-methylaminomethyl-2-thiouridine biosynthesis bifunctional protein
LFYLACELHPVLKADLQRFTKGLAGTFQPYAEKLLDSYPQNGKTVHRISFQINEHKIQLDLLYGDAASTLGSIYSHQGHVDAWFLDGFAPDKNAAMWDKKLCESIAALSKPGTTFATYTSAGFVKRNLESAGFHVTKSKGYGQKRHMLAGRFTPLTADNRKATWSFPWGSTSQTPMAKGRKIAIIGAGIAGCATAHALARRGYTVDLIEKNTEIANGTSGNPRSLVHLNPAQRLTPAMRFRFNAYLFALRHYSSLSEGADFNWKPEGIFRLARSQQEQDAMAIIMQRQLYDEAHVLTVDALEINEIAKFVSENPGFYFPDAGSLDPAALCHAWIRHKNIQLFTSHEVLDFQRKTNRWCVTLLANGEKGTSEYDILVMCNNMDASKISRLPDYPFSYNHGQTDTFEIPEAISIPAIALCHKGYLIPWEKDNKRMLTIGGSYAQGRYQSNSSNLLTQENLSLLEKLAPALHKNMIEAQLDSIPRIGTRCTTNDFQPLIGPVEDNQACEHLYSDLQRNARKVIQEGPVYIPGLYINVGHGSAGLTTTPLAGEYLASIINDESLPLTQEEIASIHPLRYLIRRLKKQQMD